MPISEDEFDNRAVQESQVTMSKAELRKTHKPIMEKRRRARINHCLNEIKSLILEALNKDPARHSKLEKADILEMAVKHLQNVQKQQLASAMASDPTVLRKFKTGFNDCSDEIEKYLSQMDGFDSGLKQRITHHLQKCMGGIEQVSHMNFPGLNIPLFSSSIFVQNKSDSDKNFEDQNNNPSSYLGQGINLIPSRLPTGEIALLLPNSTKLPSYFSSLSEKIIKDPERTSAFAAVIPSSITNRPLSPPLSPKYQTETERSSSPQGFRPVYSSKSFRNYSSLDTIKEEAQVAQVSSTSVSNLERIELKQFKYPIHNYDKKVHPSPNKIEPLCVITNQNERYKQAQVKEDSIGCEENIVRGVKRKIDEYGLLGLANDLPHKQQKISHGINNVSSGCYNNNNNTHASTSKEPESLEGSSEMWRPW